LEAVAAQRTSARYILQASSSLDSPERLAFWSVGARQLRASQLDHEGAVRRFSLSHESTRTSTWLRVPERSAIAGACPVRQARFCRRAWSRRAPSCDVQSFLGEECLHVTDKFFPRGLVSNQPMVFAVEGTNSALGNNLASKGPCSKGTTRSKAMKDHCGPRWSFRQCPSDCIFRRKLSPHHAVLFDNLADQPVSLARTISWPPRS
jgi:hypothetical protein